MGSLFDGSDDELDERDVGLGELSHDIDQDSFVEDSQQPFHPFQNSFHEYELHHTHITPTTLTSLESLSNVVPAILHDPVYKVSSFLESRNLKPGGQHRLRPMGSTELCAQPVAQGAPPLTPAGAQLLAPQGAPPLTPAGARLLGPQSAPPLTPAGALLRAQGFA